MSEVVTKRLLTDETGQLLVTALNSIAASCKPDATEINMGPNDDTKVATQINSLSEQIATHSFGDKTVSTLETALDTFCASMTDGEYKHVWVHITAASGVFSATNYTGFVECNLSSRWNILLAEQASGKTIRGCKTSSGWNWQQLARNLVIDATSYEYSDKAGWDYAYSQLGTSYTGVVYLQFKNNYMLTCIAMRQSESWGSILGIMNDVKLPYFYTVRNGPTSNLIQLASNQTSTVNLDNQIYVYKRGYVVTLSFESGKFERAYAANETFATLPTGYRPPYPVSCVETLTGSRRIVVNSDGTICSTTAASSQEVFRGSITFVTFQ